MMVLWNNCKNMNPKLDLKNSTLAVAPTVVLVNSLVLVLVLKRNNNQYLINKALVILISTAI